MLLQKKGGKVVGITRKFMSNQYQKGDNKGKVADTRQCFRCGRTGHISTNCVAKKHKNGGPCKEKPGTKSANLLEEEVVDQDLSGMDFDILALDPEIPPGLSSDPLMENDPWAAAKVNDQHKENMVKPQLKHSQATSDVQAINEIFKESYIFPGSQHKTRADPDERAINIGGLAADMVREIFGGTGETYENIQHPKNEKDLQTCTQHPSPRYPASDTLHQNPQTCTQHPIPRHPAPDTQQQDPQAASIRTQCKSKRPHRRTWCRAIRRIQRRIRAGSGTSIVDPNQGMIDSTDSETLEDMDHQMLKDLVDRMSDSRETEQAEIEQDEAMMSYETLEDMDHQMLKDLVDRMGGSREAQQERIEQDETIMMYIILLHMLAMMVVTGTPKNESNGILDCDPEKNEINGILDYDPELNTLDMQKKVDHTNKKVNRGNMEKVTITADSGAGASVMPSTVAQSYPLMSSPGSRSGQCYVSATGNRIKNEGQRSIRVVTDENFVCGMKFQVSQIRKPLASIAEICDAGNEVLLRGDGGEIRNIKTDQKLKLRRKNNTYEMDVWIMPYGEENNAQGFSRQGR